MLLVIILVALASNPLLANSPTIGFDHENLVVIDGNSLVAMSDPSLPEKSLRSENKAKKRVILTGVEAENILRCLARLESGNNPMAYNQKDVDGRPKYGLYQFDKTTFERWCVLKYGLENDIWNSAIQKECAYRMIFQDKQGWQWGTYYKCL